MPTAANFSERLKQLQREGWILSISGDQLCRQLRFADFGSAFGLMQEVAREAERIDHHPDWSNSYNRVTICLTTHSSRSLTEKDLQLAEFIGALAGKLASADSQGE